MILPAPARAKRESRRRRQARWHSVFIIWRSFYCHRTRQLVRVALETVERRRDPGCEWVYRTKGKQA